MSGNILHNSHTLALFKTNYCNNLTFILILDYFTAYDNKINA